MIYMDNKIKSLIISLIIIGIVAFTIIGLITFLYWLKSYLLHTHYKQFLDVNLIKDDYAMTIAIFFLLLGWLIGKKF